MNYAEMAIQKHREWKGKMDTVPKCPVATKDDLSIAYTPGVAAPCLEIA
ncbi:MAG: NAD-dependent malic enzyme, partial [Defluviitaleaceae bacterium]|nr:NAD-dependent malic enzyme [Defluviitaleaceae bacterium]